MSGAYRDIKRTIELDAPLMTEHIGKMVQSDAQAHRFILTLTDGGEAASLSGYSVSGKFVNAYGQGVSMKGTISGNVVTAVLDEACYHVPGMAGGFIRVQNADASIIRTVMRFTADVESDGGDEAYDPNGVIGSIDEMLAKIAAMEAATADGLAAAQEARSAGAQAIADAQAAGEEAKATAQTAADDATAAAETARSTIYTRAVAIPDASALAASHELYAQRDYPLNVAVHGYTYQEGEGDPSPENVRPISGLDAAQVWAGGKNLVKMISPESSYVTIGDDDRLTISKNIGSSTSCLIKTNDIFIAKGLKLVVRNDSGFGFIVKVRTRDDVNITPDYTIAKGSTNSVDLGVYAGEIIGQIYIWLFGNGTYEGNASVMLTYSDDTTFEPYLATTADLPLLPDNSPLMEGDTVENWAKSGCDIRKVISSADDLTLENFDASKNVVYSDTTAAIAVTDGVITTALTYPTTVYYRSTDYTPEKDLRVCRVVRRWKSFTLNGESALDADTERPGVYYLRMTGYDANVLPVADGLTAKSPTSSNNGANNLSANECAFRYGTTDRFYIKMAEQTLEEVLAVFAATPVTVWYAKSTPEIYMTDPLPLLPPAALESDTVTVTGSGETEVEYAHETKHYIDSQIAAAVALALNG